MATTADLYRVQKQDIHRAGMTLADAFQYDEIWRQILRDDVDLDQKGYSFEMPVRLCLKYGSVYATSDQFEGVAAWVPGAYGDVTLGRVLGAGLLRSSFKVMRGVTKLAWKQAQIFAPLEKARREHMKGRDYLYLMIVGVAPAHQGKGNGSTLLKALITESETLGLPIYLETQTRQNVAWYENLGFREVGETTLPVINLPHWEMVRDVG